MISTLHAILVTLIPAMLTLVPVVFIAYFVYYLVRNSRDVNEKVIAGFVERNLTTSTASDFVRQDRLNKFRDLVKSGKTIAAAKEYTDVMGASIAEARLAVIITKSVIG